MKERIWVLCTCVVMVSAGAGAAPSFTGIVDLGPLDGYDSSRADGVNNAGTVCGWSYSDDYATYWDADGTSHDLGRAAASRAQDISGDWIVGRGPGTAGWIYQISTAAMTEIGAQEIQGVNDNGYAVGQGKLYTPDGLGVWDVSPISDMSSTSGISNALQVGGTTTINGPEEAAIWDAGAVTPLGLLPGGSESKGWCISQNGLVSGFGNVSGGAKHAYIGSIVEDVPQMVDIHGSPAGNANSAGIEVLADGTVVGYAWGTQTVAFYYAADGTMYDLNDLIPGEWGWTLSLATGISDNGAYVVGRGVIDGQTHGFLLVPEPATLVLIGAGAAALWARRRKN